MKPFRPMLATDADLDRLRFPLLVSHKIDGVRAVVRDGVVYSRSNKPIPNQFVQRRFGRFEHYDGELVVGSSTDPDCYRNTVSGVMSADGEPAVRLLAFDHVQKPNDLYEYRRAWLEPAPDQGVLVLNQHFIEDIHQLLRIERESLEMGYEGLILRAPLAPYKMGRSTVKEGYLLKLKRHCDSEAEILGFEERLHNTNEAVQDERGYTKRSSHKEGKVGRGDLGALRVRDIHTGVEFNIGTGFTDLDRATLWSQRGALLSALVKYRHFPVGVKDAPRHPVFLGFRERIDL